DGSGSLLDTDYQFGGSLDVLWQGDYAPEQGIMSFARSAVTSRLTLYHRSSHLGDEYLAFGRFGRNQEGYAPGGLPFDRPPVKRVDLSYEAVSLVVSLERSNGRSPATLRAYGGGELKVDMPWGIGGLVPRNF